MGQMVESIYLDSSNDGGMVGTGAGIGAPKMNMNYGSRSQRENPMNDTLNMSSEMLSTDRQSSYRYQNETISSKRMKSNNTTEQFARPDELINLRMNSQMN